MKPLKGKRMELAIRWRDSDGRALQLLSYGSEWTVGGGLWCLAVALPASERQQLLGASDKTRGKVACPSGCVL